MADLTAFYPYVLPQVPGCPDILASQAILSAGIEFCSQTSIIQTIATQDVTATSQDYTITVGTDLALFSVMAVYYKDTWLTPTTTEMVRSALALRGAIDSNTVPDSGTPKTYFQKTPNEASISLYPIPDTTVTLGLTVKTAFVPSRTAATLPDTLLAMWAELIGKGALARLKVMPGQPFTDQGGASVCRREFQEGMRAANITARVGRVAGASAIRPRAFA